MPSFTAERCGETPFFRRGFAPDCPRTSHKDWANISTFPQRGLPVELGLLFGHVEEDLFAITSQ